MSDFSKKPLNTIFSIHRNSINPYQFPKEKFYHHSIPAYDLHGGPELQRGQAIESNKTLIESPSVLVSKLNPRKNRVGFAIPGRDECRHCCSTEFIAYTPISENTELRFYKWYFQCEEFRSRLTRVATGTTNSHVRVTPYDTLAWPIPEPTIEEQRAIATVLDTMDEVIRRTEAVLAKLRQVKAGMLHDLLTLGLDENGALRDPIRHPEQFQDSRLGRIPKEWEVVPLSTCLDLVTSGSREWAQYYATQGALFIRIGNLTREHVNLLLDDVVYVHPPQGTEGARTKVLAGDILVSITADIGIIGCVPEGIGEAFVNQHIALVRAKKEFNSRWIAHYLASPFYQQHFAQFNDGGAKAGMNLTSVGNLPVPIPRRKNEQDEMVESIDQIDLEIKNCGEELRKLAHFKQGLLHDLLTGRVRIPPHLLEAMQ